MSYIAIALIDAFNQDNLKAKHPDQNETPNCNYNPSGGHKQRRFMPEPDLKCGHPQLLEAEARNEELPSPWFSEHERPSPGAPPSIPREQINQGIRDPSCPRKYDNLFTIGWNIPPMQMGDPTRRKCHKRIGNP